MRIVYRRAGCGKTASPVRRGGGGSEKTWHAVTEPRKGKPGHGLDRSLNLYDLSLYSTG